MHMCMWASHVALVVKNQTANEGDVTDMVWFLGPEDPLQEGMETHSSILAWRIPRIEEPGGLWPIGLQRVRHGWSVLAQVHAWGCVCVCALSHFSHVRLFATPWTIAHQVSLSMGFSRQEYWSELPCPTTRYLSDAGIKSTSPSLQVDSLPLNHRGNPYI